MPRSFLLLVVPALILISNSMADPPKPPVTSPVGPIPQACCIFNKPCQNLLPDDCMAAGGVSLPGPCEADTCLGACCTPSGCVMTYFVDCALPNGYFQGYGVQCGDVLCEQPVACCLSNGTCQDLGLFACAAIGGMPHGLGTSCAVTTNCVPFGACCMPNGGCLIDVNEFVCRDYGGIYQGAGTSCFEVECPQPPQFCCLPNGCCVDVTPATCQALGGFSGGNGTPCLVVQCPSYPCPADVYPSSAGNTEVDIDDLVLVITSWGACDAPCPETDGCFADIVNCDCTVNIDDLVAVITSWGTCAPALDR